MDIILDFMMNFWDFIEGPHLPEEVLFPLELIPDTFLREHERCCDLFVKFQVSCALFHLWTSGRFTILPVELMWINGQ